MRITPSLFPTWRWRLLSLAVGLLILKVNAAIVLNYRDYFPPDFRSEFLRGREEEFFGSYQWAFWAHLLSGPISLILGLLLISPAFRLRFPRWHRLVGRVQAVNVLGLLAPSGLWMAFYAAAGPVAGAGFGTLSLLTGISVAMGWRSAVQRRFAQHRRWMLRNFTLLCSAVVLRVAAGAAIVVEYGPEWFDLVTPWACWLVPLVLMEWYFVRSQKLASKLADLLPARCGQ